MNFFKPEDFGNIGICSSQIMSNMANEKLERECRVVFGHIGSGKELFFSSTKSESYDTHRALLICIAPLEKCSHPKESVTQWANFTSKNDYFQCECGAKVKPKEFEEIK